ncbi:MAG: acetyl-CoA acetyltransferase [Sphingomonadales bacterium 35-56-22]|jgi:acetyl-CoA C-acetyltransferase|uniref:acetyl-CoA C-acyltransferase n=1 Tax=Sphingorhabdus sp. TaxID=1902408 RepID=UPI000BCBB020|nr:acetyl-CoA C-acyltransferase [Sphingorhabdus sp.]OYY15256.1 MAG: acetyl-CoA acetyltransferase [Sphingomonadales bacterium 35-56-22]OYY97923.1 MAG: acetyl-CoA acetyltransferase [Sphingomonadales bacterium 28-56-43]OYZ61207.1 MAG: acetyl-CoA acetyltransferase [Sphingomonadales bacterium 24-56-14]OZA83150.1 MAG: acetyl-CoA acetyltransferase [Sphingomonadales bacterium 39-57-19]HQS12485.1 acetyl-CoA C-acyltransferase [Sphingorhabdus sp.]
MHNADPVVILSYARTPMGAMQGALADVSATDLGATAVKAAVERSGVDGAAIERIYMGCVLPAGLGQAPARQAAIKAGLPKSVQATTVNKVCGSGMQTVIMGSEALAAGSVDYVIAGGMESMTNAPYLLKKHRSGARIGHDTAYDHMFLDGLEDAYEAGRAMGTFAQDTADDYKLTREGQDAYALESLRRAQSAIADGAFKAEIVPVTIATRKGDVIVDTDEQPGKGMPDKIPTLKPAFAKDGTITAATSSSISDGAAALVLTRQSVADANGQKPIARIVAHAAHAQEPSAFTTAPVGAINTCLAKAGWTIADVDLFEVNEAFACVAMFAMHDLGIAHDKINVHGGATALGHPIGASGARIITTLVAALQRHGKKRGLASLCIGGGEATALAIELI